MAEYSLRCHCVPVTHHADIEWSNHRIVDALLSILCQSSIVQTPIGFPRSSWKLRFIGSCPLRTGLNSIETSSARRK
eukprot:6139274-Amphidinium_carterae.1